MTVATTETEVIHAFGHKNVLATHHSTLEITRESHLTKEGDCIIAVSADKGLIDLNKKFRKSLLTEGAQVVILIETDNMSETLRAQGNPGLLLTHPYDIVIRRSSHICTRTLAVKADKAACDLSRGFVQRLRNPEQEVRVTLTVEVLASRANTESLSKHDGQESSSERLSKST